MHPLTLTAELVDRLSEDAGLGGASIVVRPLDRTLPGIELRATAPIYPASMIKLPIAMALASLVEAQAHRLDDEVVVDAANLTPNDAPSTFVPGSVAELGDLARAMLSVSDNVATNVLIDVLGRQRITHACRSLGLLATSVRRKLSGALPLLADPAATGRNAHPAGDAARLFELLADDARSGPAWIYDALLAQIWNDRLSRGWHAGDRFAHKTGDTDEVAHDGGILTVASGRQFVVVVYTERPSNGDTDARFADFAARLRPLLPDGEMSAARSENARA